MQLKSVKINNFRLIESLAFNFPDQRLIVLTGKNGSGKTTFLNALAKLFTHIEGRLCSDQARSYDIQTFLRDTDIRQNSRVMNLELDFGFLGKDIQIIISKEKGESRFDQKLIPEDAFDNFSNGVRTGVQINLPVLSYYRVHRTYSFNTFTSKSKASINEVSKRYQDGYKDSLNPRTSTFNSFVDWYVETENLENQTIVESRDFRNTNPQLDLVRSSLNTFFSNLGITYLSNLKIKREVGSNTSNHSLVVKYNDDFIPIEELSSGEKNMILLVADIARRISTLLLDTGYPIHGIVLIDEIDLHLHPSWQMGIVPALKKTFTGIQFIITTHSPQVLSSCSSNEIFQINRGDDNISGFKVKSFGEDSNSLLYKIFDTAERSKEFSLLLKKFDDGIQNDKPVEELRDILNKVVELSDMDEGIGSISLVQEMQVLLSSYEFDKYDKN